MTKRFSISIGTIFAIITVSYLAYYLLLCKNFLHTSISEIISYSHSLAITKHLLILGLLPVYIAAMVFGTAMLGIYLSSLVQHLILRTAKSK
jgi:uncharacterized membrane protein YfcA